MGGVRCAVAERRRASGLSQGTLARDAGISRQALSAIESGAAVPSTAVALRLARALGCAVEALFSLAVADEIEVTLSEDSLRDATSRRAVMGRVAGRWIAHPLDADRVDAVADAELFERDGRMLARPLDDLDAIARRVLVIGCDPALGLLAGAAARAGVDVCWVTATSARALDAVARREAHVGGLHLYDPDREEHNLPFVEDRLRDRACVVVELARTEEGLVVAADNPKAIAGVADLVSPEVRLMNRPVGAEARALLDRELDAHGISRTLVFGYEELAPSHVAVARAIAAGRADAGIATASVARAHGLGFLPLHHERFDLVIPTEHLALEPVARLLSILDGRTFRRQLAAIDGYDTSHTGREVLRT
jgi:molybdate-binding protein/DNA-binding XRE family transcriptional regulator